ncbi:MAG TPA: amino acid ABC transporter permease, partial [Candidatus Limnocylindria bacterium]|nr:amino acid ABC transporter permease [Candidatus Limnocylindria bacterium]
MTAAAPPVSAPAPILEQVKAANSRRKLTFRLWFWFTWFALVGALLALLYATGNIDTDFITSAGPYIIGGAGITIVISLTSITFATGLALVGALGRLSRNPIFNGIASLYVSLVRGTPLLVQIFFVYLALPQLGIVLPVIVGGIFALAFNYGAYMTEVFRAGIQAVPKGQREAAQALGMPEGLIMRRIVLPQAFRIVTPAIGNDFVSMIKDSSLVYVLGVQELLWRASTIGRRELSSLEALLIAAAVYWGMTIIFSYFQERIEKRMARGDR